MNARLPSPDPGGTLRLFVALPLPAPVREALAALAEPIEGVAWTRPEQLHLTLRFLGDTPATMMDRIVERLHGVRVESFILPIEGIGAFPPNGPPRVVWAGVGTGHPRLFQLRQRVDDALLAAGLDLDVRTFHPHVTLGRCQGEAGSAAGWLRRNRETAAPPFRVEAFGLFRSDLQPSGAVHTLVQRFDLGKGPF